MPTPKLTVTTKTRAQIRADFKQAFKDLQPAAATKPVTQAERLEPYREEILHQRQRGLTWKQISAAMAPPPISEAVSPKILRHVFGEADAKQADAKIDPSSARSASSEAPVKTVPTLPGP